MLLYWNVHNIWLMKKLLKILIILSRGYQCCISSIFIIMILDSWRSHIYMYTCTYSWISLSQTQLFRTPRYLKLKPIPLVFQSFTIGYLELPAISNCSLFPLSVWDSGIQVYSNNRVQYKVLNYKVSKQSCFLHCTLSSLLLIYQMINFKHSLAWLENEIVSCATHSSVLQAYVRLLQPRPPKQIIFKKMVTNYLLPLWCAVCLDP